MTKRAWIIFAAICVAIIGGLIYLSRNNKVDVANVDPTAIQTAAADNGNIADHTYGNMKSKVILFEYADFQCPGCNSAHPIIKKVVEKYKGQIGYVFRNYPLTNAHPNALAAAAAAESAGVEGKYWEMHDKLFEQRSNWVELTGAARTNYFVSLAAELGINKDKFSEHLDSASIRKKIDYDLAVGAKAGVGGTPALFIGKKDVGNQKVSNGKIISTSKTDSNATYVWANADDFEKYVIVPALRIMHTKTPCNQGVFSYRYRNQYTIYRCHTVGNISTATRLLRLGANDTVIDIFSPISACVCTIRLAMILRARPFGYHYISRATREPEPS